jgi:hypothetical protein
MTPVTDIFIKTCQHDAEYHKYCLASIEKFCSGFRDVVVIDGEHPRGYLDQQIIKLHADTYTDADFVLITDSDTLLTMPVTPETYLHDGKPVWLWTPWSPEMLAHPGTAAWFRCMKEFFGEESPGEFMRRQPFMVPTQLLKDLREWAEAYHGKSIGDYVMDRGSFSEFNCMGYYAWLAHHDKFHWIDTSKDELPELTVRQMWSHDKIEKNLEEIQRILA